MPLQRPSGLRGRPRQSGSRHNRGCAIDLTLFDLETGEVVTMPAGFDEMSPRSHADYPGGTARQRWHRKLLRDAMEAQDSRFTMRRVVALRL